MPINRSSSAVYLQGDIRSKLPHAYSSSNITAPYNPSWRCSRPYDEYSRSLDNYVPYYQSRYFARQNLFDDFWCRTYTPAINSLRYLDRVPTSYYSRTRMQGGLPFLKRYDYPYRYHYYTRYPLYSL